MKKEITKEMLKDELYDFFVRIGFEEYFFEDFKTKKKSKKDEEDGVVGYLDFMERIFKIAYDDSHKKLDNLSISLDLKDIEEKQKRLEELKRARALADKLLKASLEKRFYKENHEILIVDGFKVQLKPFPNGEV